MQFPVLDIVEVLYKQHLQLANGVLDTAISLFGIYFSFVLMPAMDVVLGTDLRPKAKVQVFLGSPWSLCCHSASSAFRTHPEASHAVSPVLSLLSSFSSAFG